MKTNHLSEEKILQKFKKLPENRKMQVLDFIDFLARKKPQQPSEGDAYAATLEALRLKLRARGGLIKGKTNHQVIKRLRATREAIRKEDYADHFGQQWVHPGTRYRSGSNILSLKTGISTGISRLEGSRP